MTRSTPWRISTSDSTILALKSLTWSSGFLSPSVGAVGKVSAAERAAATEGKDRRLLKRRGRRAGGVNKKHLGGENRSARKEWGEGSGGERVELGEWSAMGRAMEIKHTPDTFSSLSSSFVKWAFGRQICSVRIRTLIYKNLIFGLFRGTVWFSFFPFFSFQYIYFLLSSSCLVIMDIFLVCEVFLLLFSTSMDKNIVFWVKLFNIWLFAILFIKSVQLRAPFWGNKERLDSSKGLRSMFTNSNSCYFVFWV